MATGVVLQPPNIALDAGAPPLDNMQDLLRRKREIEKNKSKYHLTEADCNLILTNANEYSFTDGQVILEEGQENASVYRIKSGCITLSKNGNELCELTQGWFIGETLFLGHKKSDILEASLIAKGNVTLAEVNIAFVKKLFEADRLLALKFYRNLASKLSSIFFAINGNLMSPCISKACQDNGIDLSPASPKLVSSSSSSSNSSTNSDNGEPKRRFSHSSSASSVSSSSSSSTSTSPTSGATKTFGSCSKSTQASAEMANRRRRLTQKRRSFSIAHSAFKVYTLDTDGKGIRTCRLKNKKIKIITEAFGFKHKTTIHFAKIRTIIKTSTLSITIIFDPLKAKTLFFKTVPELDEFYGLTHSLVETSTKLLQKSSPNAPLSHISPHLESVNPLKFSSDNYLLPLDRSDDDEQRALDKEIICALATRLELKRGDVLFEEGDLYQRIYTVTKGTCETTKGDRVIGTIKEGEVFGEATLLHLRPAPVTIRISSETASVLVIPAYKLQELINSNPVLAVRVYKKTASLVEKKIDSVIATKHQITSELCGSEFANQFPQRWNL